MDICQSLYEEAIIFSIKGVCEHVNDKFYPGPRNAKCCSEMIICGESVVVVTKIASLLATWRVMLVPAWHLAAVGGAFSPPQAKDRAES